MVEIESLESDKRRMDFVVESGTVCFGHIHNALSGLDAEPLNYLGKREAATGGTVLQHFIRFRAPVLNGRWHVRSMQASGMSPEGYWVTHESVDDDDIADFSARLDKHAPPFESGSQSIINKHIVYPNLGFFIFKGDPINVKFVRIMSVGICSFFFAVGFFDV